MVKIPELQDLAEDSGPVQGAGEVAVALGLERARSGDLGLAADTAVYLRKQSEMLDLQMENLHEQRVIQINHLKRRQLIDRLRVTLQMLTIGLGIVGVGFVALALWQARTSHALVIEPISAPAELTAQGLTPNVLSAQLLDKLRTMQAGTDSARAPDTFQVNWGDDIKVEIPQTGVSIGELLRALRRWLGHDVHISAETYRRGPELALTARVGSLAGQTFTSRDGDLDGLMQQAAESIYANTQPYRYSVYLSQKGRGEEAVAVLRRVIAKGSEPERAWAYIGLAGQIGYAGDFDGALSAARAGLRINPDLASGWIILGGVEWGLGHDEAGLAANRNTVRSIRRPDRGGMIERPAAHGLLDAEANLMEFRGDFAGAADRRAEAVDLPGYQYAGSIAAAQEAIDRILAHEPLDPLRVPLDPTDGESPIYRGRLIAARAAADDDWRAAVPALEKLQAEANAEPGLAYRARLWPTQIWPWLAYGYARTGRLTEARALIARTPQDCYLCLRARGMIAAEAKDNRAADAWFARAVKAAPSLPFAYGEWGRAMAARGDHMKAEARFADAHERGPKWADALVWWGDSLRARGHGWSARMRYDEAARLAPSWPAARKAV
jgi:tetratricopeptide (TPR) repeat protein